MTALLTDDATREAARLHVSDYCDVDQGAMEPETKAWAEGIYRAGARFAQGIYEARLAEDAKVRAGLVEAAELCEAIMDEASLEYTNAYAATVAALSAAKAIK